MIDDIQTCRGRLLAWTVMQNAISKFDCDRDVEPGWFEMLASHPCEKGLRFFFDSDPLFSDSESFFLTGFLLTVPKAFFGQGSLGMWVKTVRKELSRSPKSSILTVTMSI